MRATSHFIVGIASAALLITPLTWTVAKAAQTSQSSSTQTHSSQSFLGGSGASTNSSLVKLLQKNASSYRWAAATTGSQNAASYQLASGEPVMPIGGFNGTDNSPTLSQFKLYVKQGLIHYYISGTGMGGMNNGGSQVSSQIAQWVSDNFQSTTVDGVTVYDLTQHT